MLETKLFILIRLIKEIKRYNEERKIMKIVVLFFILVFSPFFFIYSIDLGTCADDLDNLKKASSEAADAADEAEDAKEEFENCKNFPDTYDLLEDGCKNLANEYKDKINDLKNALDDVKRRIRSVNYSCGVDFSMVDYGSNSSKSESYKKNNKPEYDKMTKKMLCDLYRESKNKLPFESLLNVCMNGIMSKEECMECLK